MKELLKKYLADEQKVTAFMKEMEQNKIYTASEEKLDERYSKLKTSFEAKEKEHNEALNLIEQLKQSNAGNEALTAKIAQYESTISALQKQNAEIQKDNAIKMALLQGKAKGEDVDYLMFKLKSAETQLKVNDKGEITNMADVLEVMKKNYPSHFEAETKKKVDVKTLEKPDSDETKITKEQFDKMSYSEKNKLYNENKELYKELKGE